MGIRLLICLFVHLTNSVFVRGTFRFSWTRKFLYQGTDFIILLPLNSFNVWCRILATIFAANVYSPILKRSFGRYVDLVALLCFRGLKFDWLGNQSFRNCCLTSFMQFFPNPYQELNRCTRHVPSCCSSTIYCILKVHRIATCALYEPHGCGGGYSSEELVLGSDKAITTGADLNQS